MEKIVKKIEIDKENVEISYDKDKFDFIYLASESLVRLKHIKSGKYLADFSADDLVRIDQLYKDKKTHFILIRKDSIEHYDVKDNKIVLEDLFTDVKSVFKQAEDCYEFTNNYGVALFNTKKLWYFDDVYGETLKDDTILVEQTIECEEDSDISDRLVFGVDIHSLNITTPIWSRLQQRMIKPYTKEEVNEWCEKNNNVWLADPSEFAIYNDIIKELNRRLDGEPIKECSNMPINDEILDEEGYLNTEFVKKFYKEV